MNIEHDNSYLYLYADMNKAGFTNKAVQKICFESRDTESIKKIADYLEQYYRMYQYIKNNGVKHGTEDLFFWCNERDYKYFDVTCRSDKVAFEILNYVEQNYSDIDIYVRVQYEHRTDWDVVNDYLQNQLDPNNVDINKIRPIYYEINYCGNKLTEESKSILYQLNESYLSKLVNKKVVYNSTSHSVFGNSSNEIKGTLKRINKCEYGVFKPRATRTYYPIDLGKILSLEVVDTLHKQSA